MTGAPEEATPASEVTGEEMFDAIHLPVCIDCKKDILFVQDQGVVVGKCGCVKDRVMTERQYIFLESFDVISQSIVLAGIEFKGEWPPNLSKLSIYESKDILEGIVKREFGLEMDRSVVLDRLLRWKVVQSL